MAKKQTTIKLKYRQEMMTLNDMCVLEAPPTYLKIRELLAKHFVDDDGNYVDDFDKAQLALGEVNKAAIKSLMGELWDQINSYSKSDNDPN